MSQVVARGVRQNHHYPFPAHEPLPAPSVPPIFDSPTRPRHLLTPIPRPPFTHEHPHPHIQDRLRRRLPLRQLRGNVLRLATAVLLLQARHADVPARPTAQGRHHRLRQRPRPGCGARGAAARGGCDAEALQVCGHEKEREREGERERLGRCVETSETTREGERGCIPAVSCVLWRVGENRMPLSAKEKERWGNREGTRGGIAL